MDWSSFSIGNAAGFIKGPGKEFDEMLRSAATDITVGSITCEPRAGNSGNTYVLVPDGTSVNALGLPNPGIVETLRNAQRMSDASQKAGKRLRWSIAGFSVDEYSRLAEALFECGRLELNLGCPNVWGDSGQKPVAAFDLNLMEALFVAMSRFNSDLFYDIKVSPYSDPLMIVRVAELIRDSHVSSLVSINTFPNCIAHDGKKRELDTPGGFGGMGGHATFPIALGQVSQFVGLLGEKGPQVIGVGGVDSGDRLLAMAAEGASGIQVGTAFGERGARIFSDILSETD